VEKTQTHFVIVNKSKKHLHVRGENPAATRKRTTSRETPPRAWRKPDYKCAAAHPLGNTSTCVEKTTQFFRRCGAGGNTSTCVEKTLDLLGRAFFLEKHLHVRGENRR